jgi:5'-deoxynucleotidase YfbR-like HD superfamily hydrolase
MTIEEIRQKILTDDAFAISQLDTIATYFNLKHTPRWAHHRTQDEVESVAEHIFGMHILIDYVTPLIDEELDINLCKKYATWHDMAEAIVGDMTSVAKTEDHIKNEKEAEKQIVHDAPKQLASDFEHIFSTFDQRSTPEAKFTKAIDKIEPLFHLYFLKQKGGDIHKKFDLGWPAEKYREYRKPYVEPYTLLKRFDDVLYEETKFFHPA